MTSKYEHKREQAFNLDQHECYCCGSYGPYMNIVAGTEDGNLWWCDDPAWCRARLVAEKLKNDSRIADVS